MNDEEYDGLACTLSGFLFLCAAVYVRGDYHLFPASLPFLREVFDYWMIGTEMWMPVMWLFYGFRLLRRQLIEYLRYSLRP